MIQNSSLEALKSQIDIVDVISNHIELKKAGANLKANCPFHDEKSGSFVVSPVKQICHCFGCGYSSDAIGFVQAYKKLSFIESVESIANDMNYTLLYDKNSNQKDYSKIMEFANTHYIKSLSKQHKDYLLQRGLSEQSIKTFEIGHALSSKEQVEALKAEQFNINDAVECGVLAVDEKKNVFSRLVMRISFPIRNHTGKLIGFGGRTTTGHKAKYVNSAQTALFDKSRNLYGYNIAKEHIYKKGTFVVVEGYLDVVMFHQAGIQTAVATMGTALTELHCNTIKKANAKVLLCFDGDKAGLEAGFKASKLLSAHDIHGGVVIFPEGKDPADMVKDGDIEELRNLMKQKTPLIEFAIKHISSKYSLNVPQDKQVALKEIGEYLKTLHPLIQDEYKPYVAQVLGINQVHVVIEQESVQVNVPTMQIQLNVSEMNIIKTANESETLASIVLEHIGIEMFDYHQTEFNMFLLKEPKLQGVLLSDKLSIYSEEELKNQVQIMLIGFHQKELQNIMNSDYEYERKSFELKKTKGIIHSLKKKLR
ncbi:MAG: DNA primase [Sulfurimonas sp.]|nr:DNA primase [Sulfurimonas sp.]